MAASTSSGMQFWVDGLPVNVLNGNGNAGTMKFWVDGVPFPYIEPTGGGPEPPAAGPAKSSILLLGVGK